MPKGGSDSGKKTNKGWDPKAQSLKAYGEGRKEGKPRKRRVRYGFRYWFNWSGKLRLVVRQVSKLQAYKTRPKEFSAGNGKMSFSIVMVSARGACPCPMVQTFVHSSFPGSTLTEPDCSSYLSKVMPILLLGTSKERRVSLRLGLCSANLTTYHATCTKK